MPKRVLICDDSILMRKLVADTLVADGWTICGEAGDGREAVSQYEKLRPDAVTMDIVMPHYDGLFALPRILQVDRDAKVVVVSALAQTKMISEAIRAGAQDFIVKPFMPEQLQQTLARCALQEEVAV
jgi:two-component system chemotaxis response regulator CheY